MHNNETLEDSKTNKTRIFNLQLQVSTLCLYNFAITFIALSNERLVFNFGFGGSQYAEKLGLELTVPLLTPKFGTLFCFLSLLLNCCMLFPIVYPQKSLQYYLLPGILWNIYTLTAHISNIIEMIYDLIVLSTELSVSFNLIISALFLIALHSMLILNTLSYYDFCTLILTDTKNLTVGEIEDYFSGKQNNLLVKDFQEENEKFCEYFCQDL